MKQDPAYYWRVESGTMRCLVWANGYRQAIRQARRMRNWRGLGVLTRVQRRYSFPLAKRRARFWGPWAYVETEDVR